MPPRGWIRDLWRTTTSRLTLLYGLIFALGILALLGAVFSQSTLFLDHRVERILKAE